MHSASLLELRAIGKRFGRIQALSGVSLKLQAGRVYGLAGENGAGKSTLVKILCGVYSDYDGGMSLRGEAYRPRGAADAERAGISVFHQELPVCPSLTVAANVFLGPTLPGNRFFPDWRRIEADCEALFRELLGLEIDASRLMEECTVAERQLALLVRVLSRQARLVILDEPTTALTPPEVARLFGVIRRLQDQGITFLFVSHLLDELIELCSEIFVLRDGLLSGHLQKPDFNARTLARLIAGHEVLEPTQSAVEMKHPIKLEVRNLCGDGAFREVSFQLRTGEILGITGLQGSGRSEVARALFGAPPAAGGDVLLNGKPIRIRSIS
ncbi:MAG TPA: sugar ABC transporter ATP-binding protein, partial [Verrucomicrobiae bacterium]|nr:sugar ABC transporter ATP-binding protein [Verrucomicrobiae bacterium]